MLWHKLYYLQLATGTDVGGKGNSLCCPFCSLWLEYLRFFVRRYACIVVYLVCFLTKIFGIDYSYVCFVIDNFVENLDSMRMHLD